MLQRVPHSTLYNRDSIGLDLSMIVLGNFFYYVSGFNFYTLSRHLEKRMEFCSRAVRDDLKEMLRKSLAVDEV